MLDPKEGVDYSGTPYPFGMDPVRMKSSILLELTVWMSVTSGRVQHEQINQVFIK